MRSKAQDEAAREVLRSARWRRSDHSREELLRGLLAGRMAGPVVSHDRANVRWKIAQFASGDPRSQFGISGLGALSEERVLALMAEAAGFDADVIAQGGDGPVPVDPERVLPRLEEAGDRLAEAAAEGATVLLATGHPVGLVLLYAAVGDLLVAHGARLIRPLEGDRWRSLGRPREIRYLNGVAILTDHGSSIHTHSSEAMERMLAAADDAGECPDLVFADHGFAGAAIEAGIDTISIADVNDPAPVAAAALGRTRTVVVMDDNVTPEDYWVCFQAIAARFPR
jgi:Phosphatase